MNLLLIAVEIPGGPATIIAGVALVLILLAAAYVMFRFLRKGVRMAFRMAMVVTVLFTFVVGAVALYWFGTGTASKRSRPERSRPR